jgi:hypothetical protein
MKFEGIWLESFFMIIFDLTSYGKPWAVFRKWYAPNSFKWHKWNSLLIFRSTRFNSSQIWLPFCSPLKNWIFYVKFPYPRIPNIVVFSLNVFQSWKIVSLKCINLSPMTLYMPTYLWIIFEKKSIIFSIFSLR